MNLNDKLGVIVSKRDYGKMSFSKHPEVGEYYIAAMIAGNIHGQKGWNQYLGYIVQVRLKAGAFGSDVIFMRLPDGSLITHENQSFCKLEGVWLDELKRLFADGYTPAEAEDYTKPYTIGKDYPETGKIIQPKETGRVLDESPMMKLTVGHEDGSKEIHII